MTITKVLNYTNDINNLLKEQHDTLTKKLAHLLALMISQTPEVREKIITKAVNDEFNFLFNYRRKKFSDEFKATLRSVLIEALTKNYDDTQAKMHVYGYVLKSFPSEELTTLSLHLIWHRKNRTLPDRNKTPKLSTLIETIQKFQKNFQSIEHFQTKDSWDIATKVIRNSTLYGIPENKYKAAFRLTISFIFFGIIQFGAALAYFMSSEPNEEDLTSNLILALLILDILAMMAIHKMTVNLNQTNQERASSAIESNTQGLSSKLPDLITREIQVHETISYSYSLPLFENPQLESIASTKPDDKFEPRSAPKKLKSRAPFPIGLFFRAAQHEQLPPPSDQKQPDEVIADGVTYRRMYHHTNPTKKFVGYTEAALEKHTTPANRETFRSLLEFPRMVGPKDQQGFVKENSKWASPGIAPFKLKYSGNPRLLFTRVEKEQLTNEDMKLYLLSDSKTHNQMDRQKR